MKEPFGINNERNKREQIEHELDYARESSMTHEQFTQAWYEWTLELLLDLRDQNERIIALLEDGAISDEVRKQKMRIIALQAITDVQKRDAYGS